MPVARVERAHCPLKLFTRLIDSSPVSGRSYARKHRRDVTKRGVSARIPTLFSLPSRLRFETPPLLATSSRPAALDYKSVAGGVSGNWIDLKSTAVSSMNISAKKTEVQSG